MQLVWAGDYADNEEGYTEDEKEKNLYFLADEEQKEKLYIKKSAMRYVVNKSKGIFVDLRKVKKDKYDERINPLCLLTAEGNGRGCGDFTGHFKECVGVWARDVIYVNNEKPENMTEVVYLFSE